MQPSPAPWLRPTHFQGLPSPLPASVAARGVWPHAHASYGHVSLAGSRRSEAPAVVYVVGSFALMLLLAALMTVFGSVATLALIEASDGLEATAEEAASLGR